MTSLHLIVITLGLVIGSAKLLALLAGYGDIPSLNSLVTGILLTCCLIVAIAIVQRVSFLIQATQTANLALDLEHDVDKEEEEPTGPNIDAIAQMMWSPGGIDIKDRRYRLNVFPQCFVGSEAVDWLVNNQTLTRPEAVELGQRLMDTKIIRHVADEHPFRDDYLFYRFSSDYLAQEADKSAAIAEKLLAEDLEQLVADLRGENGLNIRDYRYRLNVYPNCFVGSEAVDWLVNYRQCTRQAAVQLGQQLIDRHVIHHVVDEHGFEDDYYFYRFYLDESAST